MNATFNLYYTTMQATTLTQIKDIIIELEKDYDFNDAIMNYGKDEDLTACETVQEVIDYIRDLDEDGDITRTEVIYYAKAIQYLAENDQSLNESIELAIGMGYELKSINSELLASLLQSQNNINDFATFLDDLESEISKTCILD